MRTIKRYFPVLLLCCIIYLVVDNQEVVTNFFEKAETHLTNHLNEIQSNGYLINEQDLSGLEDSGITGKDYSFDTEYCPYYNYLTIEGQILYKQIYANMEHLANTFVPTINITKEEVKMVMEAVYNDHPELFWINTSYSYKYIQDDIVVQITLSYNEAAKDIEASKLKWENSTNKIIEGAKKYNTDYEKELYVHNEILKLVHYNPNAPMNQSAYSALVNGETVCAGYARAFQYIMIKLQIPTYYVTGYSNQEHAWNIIKLDGEYYNVDLTWNDTSNNSYQFFNLSDNEFKRTHIRNSLSMKLPTCKGTKYKYVNTNNEETLTNNNPIQDTIIENTNINNPPLTNNNEHHGETHYDHNSNHHVEIYH